MIRLPYLFCKFNIYSTMNSPLHGYLSNGWHQQSMVNEFNFFANGYEHRELLPDIDHNHKKISNNFSSPSSTHMQITTLFYQVHHAYGKY